VRGEHPASAKVIPLVKAFEGIDEGRRQRDGVGHAAICCSNTVGTR